MKSIRYQVVCIMGFSLFVLSLILNTDYIIPAYAASNLDQINQTVCSRFEDDMSRLAGIMEEVRNRKGIKETRVAFGGIDDQIKSADYQVTYAAEAIAFQRYQKFSSVAQLRNSLEVIRQKVLRTKVAVGKAIQ